MADPLSLTLGVYTAFKEVYLLSQCVYRACESARASEEERKKLRRNFRLELVYVQAFGRYYLKQQGGTDGRTLDAEWLVPIRDIFEDLRKSFSDYKKLDDPDIEYNKFSPYANDALYDTNTIEFDLDMEIPPVSTSQSMLKLNIPFLHRARSTGHAAFKSAKWALYDKKKLEDALCRFQQETRKLKDILIMAQPAQFSKFDDKLTAILATIQNQDADKLGLVPHAKLIEFNEKDDSSDKNDYSIENCSLKVSSKEPELTCGILERQVPGRRTTDPEPVLVELKHYPPSENDAETPDADTVANVRRLAGLLNISSLSSQELRTLPFQGYIDQPDHKRYAFIYSYPLHSEQSQPISLHRLIKSRDPQQRFTLRTRFQVALELAQSIGVFHADGWVHKSVCSQSVVFFKHKDKKTLMVESPYLVDFEYSRPEQGRTYASYSKTTDVMAVYLHPDRPRMTFTKLHDLYALGVVLLEIATWTTAQDHFLQAAEKLVEIGITGVGKEEVRERFLSIARRSIPYHMGSSYMEAVVSCLDDTFRGQTANARFPQIFQREIIDKLSAKNLL